MEILIVMALVALLATFGFGVYSRGFSRSRDTKQIDDLRRIREAQEDYYFDNQAYAVNCSSGDTIGTYKVPQSPEGNNYTCYTITPAAGVDATAYCVVSDVLRTEPGNCATCAVVSGRYVFATPAPGNTLDRYCIKSLQ